MKKLLGFLTVLCFPVLGLTANIVDLGLRRNSTGSPLDSIYCYGVMSDSLMLRGLKADSIRWYRYRGITFVDSTKNLFGTDSIPTNPLGSHWQKGVFRKTFRASNAGGEIGQYTVLAKVYIGSQSSANYEENYIWTYMVVTDPQGDADTTDFVNTDGITAGSIAAAAITSSEAPNLDAAVTTRLAPTTAGRTLDISTSGEAGLDWANIGSPTTVQNLTGTTIATAQNVDGINTNGISAASIQGGAARKIGDSVFTTPRSAAFIPATSMGAAIDSLQDIGVPAVRDSIHAVHIETDALNGGTLLTATDNIGINWGDISNPATVQGLSGTTIKAVTDPISAAVQVPDIDNLVRNPHFEVGSGDLPVTGWREDNAANDIKISTALANSGTKALRKFGICLPVKSDSIYLAAGTNVTIAGRVYTSSLTGVEAGLLPVGAAIVYPKMASQATGKWHSITASGRMPSSGWYQFNIGGPTGAGDSSWWDDISLKAFPDTIGSATTQQAVISGTFIDTIFTRNMTNGAAVPNVAVLIRTLGGADWGQIITGTNGKKAVGFNAGTYLLYPGFAGGVSWRNTDNPDTFVVTGNAQVDTIRGDTFSPSTPPDPNLCTVFGWITHQGKPLAGATVRFSLVGDTLKVGSWLIANRDRDTLTNAAGYFELPLLINSLITPANTRYTMEVMDAYNVPVRRIDNLVIPNQASFEVNR